MIIWNVFISAPQRERKAADDLRGMGLTTSVPCVQKHRRARGKGGRPVLIPYLVPLMPGYVFAGTAGTMPLYDIMATRDIRGIVRFGQRIATLTDWEVDRIRLMAKEEAVDLPMGFQVGDSVRITHGPFTDFKRLISEIRGGDVRVDVEIFGKDAPVWLRPDQFEKVEAA